MQSMPREVDLFVFLAYVIGTSVCIVCKQQISFVKEYNIHRHNDSYQSDELEILKVKQEWKSKGLLSGLRKQQSIFSHNMEVSQLPKCE